MYHMPVANRRGSLPGLTRSQTVLTCCLHPKTQRYFRAVARHGANKLLATYQQPNAARFWARRASCSKAAAGLIPIDDAMARAVTISSVANWAIPGQLAVGRYPYIEPSRCSSHSVGEQQLRQLLQLGVTTFICLQGELPPQEQLALGGSRGFKPYYATVTALAASMFPAPASEAYRNSQLDRFLPPKRQKEGDKPAAVSGRKLSFAHLPITDLSIPTLEQVQHFVGDLRQRFERGEIVYLHCWGGRGRAGLMAACTMVALHGTSAEEALYRVQASFDTREELGSKSPETKQQCDFVRSFAEQWSKGQ